MANRGHITGEAALYRRLAEMTAAVEQGVLATVIATRLSTPRHEGSKMIVHADGSVTGSVGGGKAEAVVLEAALKVMADGACRRLELDLAGDLGVCGGHMEVFLEPILRSVPFVVIGAGHVGRALIELGSHLSFHFTVVDDRPEFLAPQADLPRVKTLLSSADDLATQLEITPGGALLVASRSHVLDADYLETVLRAEQESGHRFGFLGVLGSRSKAARLKQQMKALSPEIASRMESVQLPVGLEIGAETPNEIALSVLAEAVAVLRGVAYLKDSEGQDLGIRLQRRRPAGDSS
jgi:xanthine dehydrogenase accessory factor